jgi:cytochrome c551/c552
VKGFGNIMPPQTKILDGGQLLAVAAFLQNLGGNATVTGADVEALARFGCPTTTSGSGGDEGESQAAPQPVGAPEAVFTEFGCNNCHEIDKPGVKQGPSLFDIGKRMDRGEIFESILDPDAKVEAPLPKEVMKATLDVNGFYKRMTPQDYSALVTWLFEKKG